MFSDDIKCWNRDQNIKIVTPKLWYEDSYQIISQNERIIDNRYSRFENKKHLR